MARKASDSDTHGSRVNAYNQRHNRNRVARVHCRGERIKTKASKERERDRDKIGKPVSYGSEYKTHIPQNTLSLNLKPGMNPS